MNRRPAIRVRPPRAPGIIRVLAAVATALVLFAGSAAEATPIGPGHEREVFELLAPPSPSGDLGDGTRITAVSIVGEQITVSLGGTVRGELTLSALGPNGERAVDEVARSATFSVRWGGAPPVPDPVRRFALLVAQRDRGDFWPRITPSIVPPSVTPLPSVTSPRPRTPAPERAWTMPLPDPRRLVNPTGAKGLLYFTYCLFALVASLLTAPLAPWVCPVPVPESQRGPLARIATGLAVVAVALLGFWYVRYFGMRERNVSSEYETFLRMADACVAREGCPLVGTAMGSLSARLGPLFFVVLMACRRLTPDAGLVFDLFAACHGISAGITLLLATRLLGAPWGLAAGLLFAASPDLGAVYPHLSHAALVPMALTGFAWAFAALLSGGGDRALTWAALCLCCALQFHGVVLILLPATAILLAWFRPKASGRGWAAALAVVVALYFPWIIYTVPTLTHLGSGTLSMRGPPIRFLQLLWPVALGLTVLGMASLVGIALRRGTSPVERRLATALLVFFGSGIAFFCLKTESFWWRYVVVFFPYAPLTWAVGLATLARALRPWPVLRWPATVAVLAVATWQVAPVVAWQFKRRQSSMGATDWREGEAVAGVLGRHGYDRDDLREHLHGPLLEDLQAPAPRYYRGRSGAPRSSGEAVAILGCTRMPSSFATWQETHAPLGRPFVVAGYRPQLESIRVELRQEGADMFSDRFRAYHDRGEVAVPGLVQGPWLPTFMPPPVQARLYAPWSSGVSHPATVTLRATLTAVPEDRLILVQRDPVEAVVMRVGGVPRAPHSVETSLLSSAVVEQFLVRAAERTAPLSVDVVVSMDRFPSVAYDLYEEPFPSCAAPSR